MQASPGWVGGSTPYRPVSASKSLLPVCPNTRVARLQLVMMGVFTPQQVANAANVTNACFPS